MVDQLLSSFISKLAALKTKFWGEQDQRMLKKEDEKPAKITPQPDVQAGPEPKSIVKDLS